MKSIKLESLMAETILRFCENLAELGCPKKEKNPDMWYRYLSPEEQEKVASHLIDIIQRDEKRFQEDKTKKTKKSKGAK